MKYLFFSIKKKITLKIYKTFKLKIKFSTFTYFLPFILLIATMFMEFWKRKQATLAWEWNLADLDYGMVR